VLCALAFDDATGNVPSCELQVCTAVNLGSKALKHEGDKDRVKCTQIAESTSNWRSRKPHVLFWKDTGIDGDDHLIAKAVYRLSSIGAAQRIALPGLSSVVQGHSSSFSPSLPRRGNFWLQSSIPMAQPLGHCRVTDPAIILIANHLRISQSLLCRALKQPLLKFAIIPEEALS
jgi:hypothetical protein